MYLTAREFDDWGRFFAIEPWGTEEDWRRNAALSSLIANVNRGKSQRAYRMDDFMPKYGKPSGDRQSPEEQKATMMHIFDRFKKAGRAEERSRQ